MDLASYGIDPVKVEAIRQQRLLHGKKLHASRLAKRGEIERAKEYCRVNGLLWPPFPLDGMPQMAPESRVADDLERERIMLEQQRKALLVQRSIPVAKKGGRPPKLNRKGERVNPPPKTPRKNPPSRLEEVERRAAELAARAADVAPVAVIEAPVAPTPAVAANEAVPPVVEAEKPTEGAGDGTRRAMIVRACLNPRLFAIRFMDGGEEEASLWREKGRKVGTAVKVRLESGVVGANPVYEEVFD